MSQSNLTRGLLLLTLVSTLSINCELQVFAQVINDLSSRMVKQEQTIKSDQDLLQKIEILQQKAEKFRQIVDIFNLQLQEQFKSQRIKNTVDFKKVLANWEQFNIIWHDFSQDLEKNPELSNLLEETKLFNNINQNLLFQKKIISNLAQVLNESSTLIITEFQKQLFTKRELNSSYYSYGTLDIETQHKFALISTNKARELELQVAQVENILSNHLLNREQINNSNFRIVDANTASSIKTTDAKELIDKQTRFLNFNTLIVLTLLSSCAIFIILRTYKQNQDIEQHREPEISQKNVTDDLHNVEQVENQVREILNSGNQVIVNKKKSQVKNSSAASLKQSQPKFNSPSFSATEIFLTKTPKQVVQESSPIVSSLVTEEDLIVMYRQNPQLLSQKVIKVEVTRESIQRTITGQKPEIFFKKASNDSYWIVMEPKLENNCYFLVPKPNLEINSLIYPSMENIFNCTGYHNRTSNKFNLKLSAMVQIHEVRESHVVSYAKRYPLGRRGLSDSTSSWKLIGTGEITFS